MHYAYAVGRVCKCVCARCCKCDVCVLQVCARVHVRMCMELHMGAVACKRRQKGHQAQHMGNELWVRSNLDSGIELTASLQTCTAQVMHPQ